MLRFRLAVIFAGVLPLAGCTSTSLPASAVGSSRAIFSDALPGTQGKTVADQNAIDSTMAGPCAVKIYTKAECQLHTQRSRARRQELQ